MAATPGIEFMRSADMDVIQKLHDVAQRHRLQLSCYLCGAPFIGDNTRHDDNRAIRCKCREIKSVPSAVSTTGAPA